MKKREDVRSWLRTHGHEDVVRKIDMATERWAREGKKTRRNWWDILAGDSAGNPRQVLGVTFPVLDSVRRRKRHTLSAARVSRKPVRGSTPKKPAPNIKSGTMIGAGRLDALPSMRRGRPKPFVKWAGGKRQLLTEIFGHLPEKYGTYHEPFLGGGAVFFALSPPKAFLSDSNQRLVRCYKGIRNNVEKVISLLSEYKKSRGFFLEMRKRDIDEGTDAEVAAWFIFLNKLGYNGLYRVNSKNRFNVPYGKNSGQIFDEDNLRACQQALAKADLACEDFLAVEGRAQPGDLVYFDPPYVPLSATSYFTSYTAKGFSPKDQTELRDLALRLKNKGVTVILSNSSTARSLYRVGFSVTEVLAGRAVNSRADRRGKITELLIR